jgi:hypothetical protein
VLATLAAVGMLAFGCDIRGFRVQIPGFDTQQIQGIWLWRQAESGDFEKTVQIRFTERVTIGALEYQIYESSSPAGGFTLQSLIKRSTAAPGDATLELAFMRVPGTYKVSSYNAAGESPLSQGQITR